ncbi:MAG: DUF4369 domain-containing protein [Prevotella sp.]|jgi:hypothetical protein|nr:DUF4369 domain-containing protein [Prevotella sp.]
MKKTFLGLAIAGLALAACQSDTYYIKGEAHGIGDGTVLYLSTDLQGHSRPADSIIVSNGKFAYRGTTDADSVWRLYTPTLPEAFVYFFAEPRNVYIELYNKAARSRVSGTKTNNEWQALNDTVAKYDRYMRKVVGNDSLSVKQKSIEMNRLYTILDDCIRQTARRNSDNVLGRFISTHYE